MVNIKIIKTNLEGVTQTYHSLAPRPLLEWKSLERQSHLQTVSAGALIQEYQTLALPFRRWGVKPHSSSTAGFLRGKSCSISIPCGFFFFFFCNFMFCLIVQSGRCDFHVTFYPSVFLYQKDKQKVLGLLQRMPLSTLTVRNIQTAQGAEWSSGWAQKAHFLPPGLPPTSPNRNSLGMTNKEITSVSHRESPCS